MEMKENLSLAGVETQLPKWKKVAIFISLLAMNFFGYASYSVISPFFPEEGRRKGVSKTVLGLIFSSYAITLLLFYPTWGRLLSHKSPKWFLVAGSIVCGSANITFGFASTIQDTASFTAACFVARVVEAAGFAALDTGTFAALGRLYPENLGTAISMLEISIGIGMGLGPAMGSALFSVGGYHLPFSTLGGMLILMAPIVYLLIACIPGSKSDLFQQKEKSDENELTPWKLVSIGTTQLALLVVAGCSLAYSCYHPTLALHLQEQLGIDEVNSGYFFSSEVIAYAVLAPVVGGLSDYSGPKYRIPIMAFGLVLCGCALLLLGPSTIFQLFGAQVTGSIATNLVACALMGAGEAVVILPSYQVLIDGLKDAGYDDVSSVHGLVGGLVNGSLTLGHLAVTCMCITVAFYGLRPQGLTMCSTAHQNYFIFLKTHGDLLKSMVQHLQQPPKVGSNVAACCPHGVLKLPPFWIMLDPPMHTARGHWTQDFRSDNYVTSEIAMCLGIMIGPIVGGFLAENFDFQFATSAIGGGQFLLAMAAALVLTIGSIRRKAENSGKDILPRDCRCPTL